jgi:hypothetical protein
LQIFGCANYEYRLHIHSLMNQYLHLHDVGVDSSDNVYVTDKDNCKVEKLTADRNFIRKWGSEGYDEGQFWLPHDIAIDSSDNVYM